MHPEPRPSAPPRHRRYRRILRAALALWPLLAVAPAAAGNLEPSWTLLDFGGSAQLSVTDRTTFRELLRGELAGADPAAVYVAPPPDRVCEDPACAAAAGREVGAARVLQPTLSTLGKRIFVSIELIDVEAGRLVTRERITIDRVEDLVAVAERMATALVGGVSTREALRLGNVTAEDSRPEQRRKGASGPLLRIGWLLPLRGYGDTSGGIHLDFGWWVEMEDFALEPRIGFRFDDSRTDLDFREFPLDLSIYRLFGRGDFTPYLGGGFGLHWLRSERLVTARTGDFLISESQRVHSENGWSYALGLRGGMMLFRTWQTRVLIHGEYELKTFRLHGEVPQIFMLGAAVVF